MVSRSLISEPYPATQDILAKGVSSVHTAAAIVRHALRMLLQDPMVTLRVIAPALALLGLVGLATLLAAPSLLVFGTQTDGSNPLIAVLLMLGFIAGYGLMAMLWHRHALPVPAPRALGARLFAGYMWRVLLLGLIQLGFSIAIVIPLLLSAAMGQNDGPAPNAAAVLITTFLTQLLLLWVSLRFSLILPAAAVGQPLAILESWSKTHRMSRPLWGVAAILAAFNTALAALIGIIGMIGARTPLVALIVELPVYILQGMLIFGVLTTLYAHLVQNSFTNRIPGADHMTI